MVFLGNADGPLQLLVLGGTLFMSATDEEMHHAAESVIRNHPWTPADRPTVLISIMYRMLYS